MHTPPPPLFDHLTNYHVIVAITHIESVLMEGCPLLGIVRHIVVVTLVDDRVQKGEKSLLTAGEEFS